MTVRADYDPVYFRRFLYMALFCGAAGAWFFFDGSVTYPAELERCEAYWQPTDNPGNPWEPLDPDDWAAIAKEKGWSQQIPKETPDKQREKIGTQFFYGIGSFVIVAFCLLKWFLPRGTWVEGDEKSIRSSWGTEFEFSQVVSLNKRKWTDKGIAKVRYEEDGHQMTFVMDDFKYQRVPMDQIIRALEATLKDDQILNGERQPERKPETEATQDSDSGEPEEKSDDQAVAK